MTNTIIYAGMALIVAVFWGIVLLFFGVSADIAAAVAIVAFILGYIAMQIITFGGDSTQ